MRPDNFLALILAALISGFFCTNLSASSSSSLLLSVSSTDLADNSAGRVEAGLMGAGGVFCSGKD